MLYRANRLFISVLVFALAGASASTAAVLDDMQMVSGSGGRGQGAANPGPVDQATYDATASRLEDTSVHGRSHRRLLERPTRTELCHAQLRAAACGR